MLLRELLGEIDARLLRGDVEPEITDLCMDSREVSAGALFVCICGAIYDGNDYIGEAIQNGAAAILSDKSREQVSEVIDRYPDWTGSVLLVSDCRSALAHLAAQWYGHPAKKLTLIGVTGTKGKTTSTYMMKSILENAGRRVGLIGTNEVIVGRKHFMAGNTTPESLLLHKIFRQMVEEGLDTVVMEVSSQAIKLKRTEGLEFDFGIFTNLSPDHIAPAEHKDFQEYLECKSRLFRQCKIGLMNGDDPYADQVLQGHTCEIQTYGLGKQCMLRAENIQYTRWGERLGVAFDVTGLMDFSVRVPLPGTFSVYNALAAISICRNFHVRETDIQRSMLSAKVRGRIELVPGTDGFTVMIDYAHNPIALKSLLETLRAYNPTRLVCCFGCGGNRPVLRRHQMGFISGSMADLTILTDDNPRDEDPRAILEEIRQGVEEAGGAYRVIPDRRAAIAHAIYTARKGDIIVLAGKGHEEYQEIKGIKYPLDEREIVQEILAE